MNRKKFPKAVMRTAEQMRDEGASAAPDNVIEMMPRSEPTPLTSESATQRSDADADPAAAVRRRQAIAIVERYANYSAVGGAIPVPLANAAANVPAGQLLPIQGFLNRIFRLLANRRGRISQLNCIDSPSTKLRKQKRAIVRKIPTTGAIIRQTRVGKRFQSYARNLGNRTAINDLKTIRLRSIATCQQRAIVKLR